MKAQELSSAGKRCRYYLLASVPDPGACGPDPLVYEFGYNFDDYDEPWQRRLPDICWNVPAI